MLVPFVCRTGAGEWLFDCCSNSIVDRMCMTSEDRKLPADSPRNPRTVGRCGTSVVVENRAEAALLGEQRIAAEPEQAEAERLVHLLPGVALDLDGNGPGPG